MANTKTHHSFVYALQDPRTKEIRYIGQSINPIKRLEKHFCDRKRSRRELREWIENLWAAKYRPKLIILEKVHKEYINEQERYWAIYYQNQGEPLLNYNLVKIDRPSRPHSEETKKKISKSHTGMLKVGHPQTEETKKKISETKIRTGCNKQTPEWTEKVASQQRGIPWSEEKRAKIMAGRKLAKITGKSRRNKRGNLSE